MVELTLTGTAFEIGRRQGESFSERIRQMAAGLPKDALQAAIAQTSAYLDAHFPAIADEIRGIGEGAGLTFEQAFLLSNRCLLDTAPAEGCSHVAVTRNGRTVVGMNKDSRAQTPDDFFIARIRPSGGHATIGYRHIGRVWGYAVNDSGLCAAGTAAYPPDRNTVASAVGLYFAGPIVLSQCGTVKEAVELLMGIGPVSESGNVLVADQYDAAVIEFSPCKRLVRRPEGEVIASTNFYASGQIDDANDKAYQRETRARYDNILRLASEAGAETIEGMQRILSHHAREGSVCRHDPSADRTVFSFVASPSDRRFTIAPGPPCTCTYDSYAVD